MNLEPFFLTTFFFGVLFTAASFLGITDHIGHAHFHGHLHGHDTGIDGPFHFSIPALIAFFTWFGATGYLLTKFAHQAILISLPLAVVVGGTGWILINLFLAKIQQGDRVMDPEAYRLEGKLAHVTVQIPANGVGEIVLVVAGARRSEAARSFDGRPIAHGSDVVVTHYQQGIALVHPWEE